jgi:hypothetical protein
MPGGAIAAGGESGAAGAGAGAGAGGSSGVGRLRELEVCYRWASFAGTAEECERRGVTFYVAGSDPRGVRAFLITG